MIDTLKNQDINKFNVSLLCKTLNVSKNAYYTFKRNRNIKQDAQQQLIVSEIENIVTEFKKYGYRRVKRELNNRNFSVGFHKTLKLMRENKLLCKNKRKFKITTDSKHKYHIYPNLLKDLDITRINQVWVADITYVRLSKGFCYLAAVLDIYSRKIVGWNIRLDMSDELTVVALNNALETRGVNAELIHHADRGSQYASTRYVSLLKNHEIKISMSRTGNPYDNAFAESFMKTLKCEEVYLNDYENVFDANQNISNFIEKIYNKKRMHSSLNYVSPVAFENQLQDALVSSLSVPKK